MRSLNTLLVSLSFLGLSGAVLGTACTAEEASRSSSAAEVRAEPSLEVKPGVVGDRDGPADDLHGDAAKAGPARSGPDEDGAASEAEAPAQVDALALPDAAPGVDHAFRAEQQLEAGDLPDALASLRRHLALNPETTELLLRIGRLARELGQPETALLALTRAETREPDAADVLLELGRLKMHIDDPEAAEIWASRLVKLHPDDGRAWNLLGRSALEQSAFQRAEFAFRRAVELSPTEGMYLNNLGLLYVMRRDGERAVSALEASLECFGDRSPRFVHNNLGLGRELQGDLTGAERAFRDALHIDPSYVNARVNLDRVQAQLQAKAVAAAAPQPAP